MKGIRILRLKKPSKPKPPLVLAKKGASGKERQRSDHYGKEDNEDDVNDDDDEDGEMELFCICRKPDDHTVMIGCDGPCEDWFHTRCVNMTNEKVALISKWYCMFHYRSNYTRHRF